MEIPYPVPTPKSANSIDIREILNILISAANTDGAHHKQYDILCAIKLIVGDKEFEHWINSFDGEQWGAPDPGIPG